MSDPTSSAYAQVGTRSPYMGVPVPAITIPGYDLPYDPSYRRHYSMWRTIRDCYDGEPTIKAAGETYLRKLAAHSPSDYDSYLSRGYFYNAIERTHRGLMGSLFSKPPEITLPPNVKIDLSSLTLESGTFLELAKKLGHELLLTGRFGLLADFKGNDPKSAYLAPYEAENIYAHRRVVHRGRSVVDRIVLLEHEPTLTEYSRTTTLIIRILRLDPVAPNNPDSDLIYSQQILRPNSDPKLAPAAETISFVARGRTLNYIPFVCFNPMDLDLVAKNPPLQNIATLNISHYASTAHLEHGRFYAGMPTYVVAGDEREIAPGLGTPDPLTVGPSNVWDLAAGAKAFLLEFTGHGLTFLENAVDSKQLQMQSLGGRLISSTRRAAPLSSEAWQLMETGDEATLLDIAQTADLGVARALSYLAHIRGEINDPGTSGIKAEFNKEFVRTELTGREIRALQSLYERGVIPLDVMYYALREVGVIPIEYTLDDFTALLKKNDQIFTPPPIPVDPNKQQPAGGPPAPPRNPANNPSSGTS